MKISKKELFSVALVCGALGCASVIVGNFFPTYLSIKTATPDQAQVILLLYSSTSIPVLAVGLLLVSLYLIIKAASNSGKEMQNCEKEGQNP